ncbi:MAG: DUF2971 domain-containing protein [Thermotogae bacterium]|nr:DUF2971 domain-containing protein [Thermotogota bacterium]
MLYKYTTFERLEEILKTGSLHFSSPYQLNDFYEGWGITESNGKTALFNAMRGIWILSLSKTWDSIPMWSHYANNNNGVCIGFDEKIKFRIINKYKKLDTQEVKYACKVPMLSSEVLDSNELKNFWSTKGKSWEYEHEVRILFNVFGGSDLNDYIKRNHMNLASMGSSPSESLPSESLPLPNDWLDNDCKESYHNEFKLGDLLYYHGGLNIKFKPESLKEIIFGLKVSKDSIDEIRSKIQKSQQYKIQLFQIKALNGVYEFDRIDL